VVTDIREAADGRIPIRVDAVPSEPRSYTVGGGYSTDDGPRIRFSYDNDRRNRRGHQLSADATLAEVRQTAAVEYRVPVGNPQRDWRSYRVGLARDDFVAGVSSAARFSVHRTQAGELVTTTRFVDALFERDEIGTYSFSNSMLIPGISWLRNYRDDLARPREGHRLSLVLSAGVGSEVSLLRADFRGKWITALPWDARVLLRGRIGAMVEDGPFGFVPLSMRFFAGGDNSVRGYDYQSLGPRDQFDDLIGGNRLIEASVEYEHPVLDDWSVAAFVDSGNAFLDSGFDTQTGAGIGARWFSPLGPVRLDIAWPLHGADRSPEIHLSLGPDL
jgi:translocation and assembly module TamA